mmetsp:Transcript_35542/g.101535  ORF Transcript_35542/g.101535 Transcript_35542/m.101535 type:complete len:344 (-) Transcript_35542:132-1163(-)
MPLMPRRAAEEESGSSSESEASDDDLGQQKPVLSFLQPSKDPRTLSQIKRSRIDLARRYVFLCPLALSKHFEALPNQAKDSALLVFRCRRNWLFPDSTRVRRMRTESRVNCGLQPLEGRPPNTAPASSGSRGLGNSHYQGAFAREFLQWVLTKEKEGCVFWYKPDKDLRRLSRFLEEKTDPASEQPYRPLLLDPQWWRVRFVRTAAKYVSNPNLVVACISRPGLDVDLPVLQELIFQSNPTLEPISKWPYAPSMRFLPRSAPKDLVGEVRYRGYIDQDKALDGSPLPPSAKEHTRLSRWPDHPRDRLDNLHHLWQVEEAGFARRQAFTLSGLSALGGRPLTAR